MKELTGVEKFHSIVDKKVKSDFLEGIRSDMCNNSRYKKIKYLRFLRGSIETLKLWGSNKNPKYFLKQIEITERLIKKNK